ncbi:Reverse gyrase 1 [uncultured archaeon]|nr:Reverse gyrase 1 [uncultured archaeon]
MQLIIAEKPKVAEKIAQALAEGPVLREKGRGQASYFIIRRHGQEIAITPAVGHIYGLAEKNKTGYTYPVFDIEWKPAYEAEKEADYTKGYVQTLEMLGKKADEVIVACDYDIEGSLIGYNALRYACKKKDEQGRRMKFSALTAGDLVGAYESREPLDVPNAQAGEARHILDWYYGINLSRALMGAIKAAGKFQVMSIGRVQGPALKLLADREKAIEAFVPSPYWELTCKIDGVEFKHEKDRFLKKEEATAALAGSKPGPHSIASVERKPFEQQPNPPFDLTSLQVEAYRQFKFAPTQTLEMAQTLYEQSMISYPRTSSQKLPEKLGLERIVKALAGQPEYAPLCKQLADAKRFKPHEGKKDDPAHPAIHPTGQKGAVGERERKLYDLIVRRFLACMAPNAQRESAKVKAKCGSEGYATTGSRTTSPGWFEFYKPYVKLEEITLPGWKEGQSVEAKEFSMADKMTQPPKRLTPASVISELEDHDLGTKATRAVVVDTLFKRGYLTGKTSITVTPFGRSVCDIMGKYAPEILDEELTRGIEKEMEAIQEKHIHPNTVVDDGKKILTKILDQFKQKEEAIGGDLSVALTGAREAAAKLGPCPACGQDLKKIHLRGGRQFVGCSGYPTCKQTYPLPQGALIEAVGKTCEKCNTPQIRVIRKGRRPFEMCLSPTCETKKAWGFNSSSSSSSGGGGSVRFESEVKKEEAEKKKEAKAAKPPAPPPSAPTPLPGTFKPAGEEKNPASKPSPPASSFFKGTGAPGEKMELKEDAVKKKAPAKKAAAPKKKAAASKKKKE